MNCREERLSMERSHSDVGHWVGPEVQLRIGSEHAYRMKPVGKRLLGRPRSRWEKYEINKR
jgi:hypothetical protein